MDEIKPQHIENETNNKQCDHGIKNIARWNKSLVVAVIVLLVFSALTFLRVFTFNITSVALNTYSNVIIAISNILMASAAIYAAFNAKNWLSPKIQNEGFTQASQCMLELTKIRIAQQHLLANYVLNLEANF
ncbi:MAG TPA: hypothetical protein VGH05_15915 [Buttiauxella sp.]|jgi:hypothetical protein